MTILLRPAGPCLLFQVLTPCHNETVVCKTYGPHESRNQFFSKCRLATSAQALCALAHGQRHGSSGQDDRGHGLKRRNRSTIRSIGVGDHPWVISLLSGYLIFAKSFG